MSFFQTIETDIEEFFDEALNAAKAFVESLAGAIAANGGQILIDAAVSGVAAAETAGGTASEKLAAATAAVESSLATQGVSAAKSAINGAIEAAVASLPKQAAATTATLTTPLTVDPAPAP